MTDLICKNTMRQCHTPGMCSPFGGCREVEPVSSVWLEQLRSEFRAAVRDRDQLKAENEALRKDAERYRWLRDEEYLHNWAQIHVCDEPRRAEITDAAIDQIMGQGGGNGDQ